MPRALITDLSGTGLEGAERAFLREFDPLGVILFGRNIEKPAQVRALVNGVRDCLGRADAPVMIDQEGGRVARLREPHWWSGVPAGRLGRAGPDAARLAARLLAADLHDLGIDVVCAPCLDLDLEGMHAAIGDRAFGADPHRVAACARAACEGFAAGGVQPMIKHIPGHGRILQDPHETLPSTNAGLDVLRRHDFLPFRALRDIPWAMVAHVVYEAIDPARPASCSPAAVGATIRREIGFGGVLVSDAIDMAALSGPHEERARVCLEAGLDVVMHCNQTLAVRRRVAAGVPELAGNALARVRAAAASRPAAPSARFDRAAGRAELEAMLEAA